jgi:hypothetical protein
MVVPLLVAGGALAAAGAIGGIASGALGSNPGVNANYGNAEGYTYSGDGNGYFDSQRKRLQDQELGAQQRTAYQTDWGQANHDYANAGVARSQQQALAENYQKVVNGQAGPSLAEQQMRAGQERAAQQQMVMAAGARGGTAAMLNAQRSAQAQGVLAQSAVNRDAGMMRTQEQQQARQEYAGLLGNMRSQDYAARAGSQQQAMGQAGIEMQQRSLNDQRSATMLGAEAQATAGKHAAAMGQLQGTMGLEQANQQANQWEQGTNAQIEAQNKARKAQFWGSLMGGGGQMMGMGIAGKGGG